MQGGYGPSATARAQIPAAYLQLYLAAGERYGIDPWILAAIGAVETDHGRSRAPGVHSGVNTFGCCAGPMQFSVTGTASTWERYRVDGDNDGRTSPYDPADAIPAAARYLQASGAPADYHAAIFAYSHAEWYVADVLAKANQYRGQATQGGVPVRASSVQAFLSTPRVQLTASQVSDLRSGQIDPRVVSILAWMGRQHSIIVTALRSDHGALTVDGNVSNHSFGRAADIGAVDGQICTGTRSGKCGQMVDRLARITGPLRSTELIYCFDADGPSDPRGFARADPCNHLHVGWDG